MLNRVRGGVTAARRSFMRQTTPGGRLFMVLIGVLFVLPILCAGISGYYSDYHFSHLSASEHLGRARAACGISSGQDATNCTDPDEAFRQLWAISKSAPEYKVAADFIVSLQHQHVRLAAEATTKSEQARSQAFEQMQRNTNGESHDAFTCATSTENLPIMSFDSGQHWWKDDGRCASKLQSKRDSDAEIDSYWSTTVRVYTDMNSSWLPNEERTCRTYPDNNGKVSVVSCDGPESHADHNIPVTFWGGVDRNTTSDWKCRREGDDFVCRAIN